MRCQGRNRQDPWTSVPPPPHIQQCMLACCIHPRGSVGSETVRSRSFLYASRSRVTSAGVSVDMALRCTVTSPGIGLKITGDPPGGGAQLWADKREKMLPAGAKSIPAKVRRENLMRYLRT